MFPRDKVIAAVENQADIQPLIPDGVIGRGLQNLEQIVKTHLFFVVLVPNLLLDSLYNAEVILFDLMYISGNRQRHLFHLLGKSLF